MPFWVLIIIAIALLAVGLIIKPKIKNETPKAEKFDRPTANERSIPSIAGTVMVSDPTYIWQDDQRINPIKIKGRTSGYYYHTGWAFGFSHGNILDEAELLGIWYRDKREIGDGVNPLGTDFQILKPDLFGGYQSQGGLIARITFYKGGYTQNPDAYLAGQLPGGVGPGWRGLIYMVWHGPSETVYVEGQARPAGYVGTSPNPPDSKWLIRNPPYAEPVTLQPYKFIERTETPGTYDANPATRIFEMYTNRVFGMGVPISQMDVESFAEGAATLVGENFGISHYWTNSGDVEDEIGKILQVIDAVVYTRLTDGKRVFKLIRNDYNIEELDILTDSDIVSVKKFSRGGYQELINTLRIKFTDPTANYKERWTEPARNTGLARVQGGTIAADTEYEMIYSGVIAARVAKRELKIHSTPLATVSLIINRRAIELHTGAVFRWRSSFLLDEGIDELVIRVRDAQYNELGDDTITIEGIEDVFYLPTATYTDPGTIGGGTVSPMATTLQGMVEQPYFFSSDAVSRVLAFAANPDGRQINFDLETQDDGGSYALLFGQDGLDFAPTGTAAGGIPQYGGPTLSELVLTGNGLNRLSVAAPSPGDLSRGKHLALILEGDVSEFISFQDVSVAGSDYTLNDVERGLLDTAIHAFSSAARVWFIEPSLSIDAFDSFGAYLDEPYTGDETVAGRFRTRVSSGVLPAVDAALASVDLTHRARRPIPPGKVFVNEEFYGWSAVGEIRLTWAERNRVNQNPAVVQDAIGFTAEAGTQYIVRVYDDADALVRTATVSGLAFTYTEAMMIADGGLCPLYRVELSSTLAGLESFDRHSLTVEMV